MLNELNNLKPENWIESINKRATGSIIYTKAKLGLGLIKWTDDLSEELHKPIQMKSKRVFALVRKTDDIWAAYLIDLKSHSNVNAECKHSMDIDVFSKYGWAIKLRTKTGTEITEAFQTIFDMK